MIILDNEYIHYLLNNNQESADVIYEIKYDFLNK